MIERYDYEPCGAVVGGQATDGPGYNVHVSDAATGLSYMQQRYMDPQLGVFLSVDPVAVSSVDGKNFNRYWYVSTNPISKIDPDGRCDGPWTCAIDRDIAAMNSGDMTQDEFASRSEARAAGAVIGASAGPAIVATDGRVVPLTANLMRLLGRKEISPEARRDVRSLEKKIEEHQRKLQDFKDNPTVRPGMEKLPQELVARQQ
ncbi:RHS repeat-associated protein [Stenotrophomonas sp. 2619]|uniref:RHS repeat-associated core domain-containing protein n=1 Tax=Stenotrophomonas sp. 2619 TaxID=3156316 RepID=UPI00339685AF